MCAQRQICREKVSREVYLSTHSMDSILLVKNKDCSGDGEEFTEVPRAVTNEKFVIQTIQWSLANLGYVQRKRV